MYAFARRHPIKEVVSPCAKAVHKTSKNLRAGPCIIIHYYLYLYMIHVSVIGASGYSGAELIRILMRHSRVTIGRVFANNSAGKRVDEVHGIFRGRTELVFEKYSLGLVSDAEIVFIALPSGEAMHIVPELIDAQKRVIDLGGDFRLKDVESYRRYYKRDHIAQGLLPLAVYGLPEWKKDEIRSARLVANPGCYPTSALLPLIPMLREDIVEERGTVISALSGVSGAGRSASVDLSFSEVNESVRAYKVGVHQHTPEIESTLSDVSHRGVAVTFVPHLIPVTRGINTTIYAGLKRHTSPHELYTVFQKHYATTPFVRVDEEAIPEMKNVNYTNFCDIGFRVDDSNNRLILVSVIDNLVKGAAGQAVQNMNIMLGFDETEGLL